jgi:poly(ADP-ribose) glycohydrolase ARH3
VRGALLGCLLGDAFGRPLEGVSADDSRLPGWVARRRSGHEPLSYSDDAEMMMLLAESLIARGQLEGEHLLEWMARHHDPVRGYGKGTRAVFAKRSAYALFAEGSQGNGAAVRVVPISSITHAHPAAVDAAVVMARAIAAVLRAGELDLARLQSAHAPLRPRLTLIPDLLHVSPGEAARI